jgi:hypothetical protein
MTGHKYHHRILLGHYKEFFDKVWNVDIPTLDKMEKEAEQMGYTTIEGYNGRGKKVIKLVQTKNLTDTKKRIESRAEEVHKLKKQLKDLQNKDLKVDYRKYHKDIYVFGLDRASLIRSVKKQIKFWSK